MKTQIAYPLSPGFRRAFSKAAAIVPSAVLALGLLHPSSLLAGTYTTNTTDPAGWQAPPGVTSIQVECWGGGGAGGAANNTSVAATGTINVGGGGGAGGAYARKIGVAVTPGNFYAITIPAAAPAPPANSADGLRINGEAVSFTGNTATVTAAGGEGGASIISAVTSTGLGGTGSTVGCVGDVVFAGGSSSAGGGTAGGGGGGAGSTQNGFSTTTNAGGAGGISGGGKGGQAPSGSNVGNAGGAPVIAGGGGSGARMQRLIGTANAGGAGAVGQITLTWTDPVFSNKLVVTTVPASASAGVDFSVTVQAQDSGGSPIIVTQDTNITLTASGAGTLTGKTATILSGTNSVTLNTVQYTNAESITLTATGLTGDPLNVSVPSSAFTVNAGVATQLVFTTQPSTPTAVTTPFATQPVVQIRDAFGNVVTTGTDATANVALALTTGTGTLGGTTSMNAVAGVADFIGKGLNIDQAGTNKLLTATATLNGVPVTRVTAPAITITSLSLTWLASPATFNWTTANEVNWSGGSGVYVGPLASSVTFDETGSAASPINLVGTLQPISVTVTSDSQNYTFSGSGKISGTTGITKSGASTLTLATANDHSGNTALSAGTLVSANPLALGTGLLNFPGGSTGTLRISTDGGDTATPISSNSGTANVGTDTWSSNWTIASGVATPGPKPGINHSLGHLNLALAKMNIVAGPNVSGGNPRITFATMQLTSGSGAAPAFINPTTASVSIGNVTATGGANKTLYLGGTSMGNAITGDITTLTGLAINKRGSSSWTLSGTNSYTGATTIEQGALAFGGGSLTSNVIVQDEATLGTAVGSTASTTGDVTFVGPNSKVSVTGSPTLASYTLMTAINITGTPVLDPVVPGYALLVDGGNTLKLVQSGTPYDTWVSLYQPGFTNNLPAQDQDGDGLTNQQEFAYGLNPKSGSSVNPIVVGLNGGNGNFSFSRNINSGLTYKVWSSVDLATWTERPAATQTLTGSPDSFGTQTVNVTTLGATAVNGKLFVRVTAN